MLVASSRGCIGPKGRYEIWSHRVTPGRSGSLRMARSVLTAFPQEIEEWLGLSSGVLPEAAEIFALARRFARDTSAWGPQCVESVATAALIRICDRSTHPGMKGSTGVGTGRPEVVTRDLFGTHSGTGRLVLGLVKPPSFGEDGIARVPVHRAEGIMSAPIVQAPVTPEELISHPELFAVEVSGVRGLTAVVHRLDGGVLGEQLERYGQQPAFSALLAA